MFFVTFFCYVFQTPLLPTFWSQRHPPAPIWSPFGCQVDDISNKSGKVATAFSLERGHQNQAFQGLHFTIFHHFLIRVVETCDCHPPSKALFTLSSISGPIWHPIWDPNLQYFALHFSCDFFTKYFLTSEISFRHLRHNGGKGGTGRHLGGIWQASGRYLGGIWEASGTPGGHGAPGGSKSQKSMTLSDRMEKLHFFVILRGVFEGQVTK